MINYKFAEPFSLFGIFKKSRKTFSYSFGYLYDPKAYANT